MPEYDFINDNTGKIDTVVLHMNEEKVYLGPDGKDAPGTWRRLWSKPRMGVDTVPVDPYSASDFARITNKSGVMGDLWERSAEMSAKRADKEGTDPVKQQYYKSFSAKRKGKKHPAQVQEETVRNLKNVGVNLDWGDQSVI